MQMKIILCDTNDNVCKLWRLLLKSVKTHSISIHHSELFMVMDHLTTRRTSQSGNTAIVSPGNSFGYLGGGFDLALRNYLGGLPFERWIRSDNRYYPVGSVRIVDVTEYNPLLKDKIKYVIFTPTVVAPCRPLFESARALKTGYEPVFNATWCALTKAPEDVDTVLMPGMCTGYVGVPPAVSCKSMVFALRLFMLNASTELKNVLIMSFLGYPFKPFWSSECMAEGKSLGLNMEKLEKFDVENDDIDILFPTDRS